MGVFGLNVGSGEFLPQIRINGKDGGVQRTTYEGGEKGLEIIENFVALFDFATLQTGWMYFGADKVDLRMVALGDPLPDSPGEDYKQGIRMVVMLPGELGCHEIATSANGVLNALGGLYETVQAAPEHGQGLVPVVAITHFDIEKTKRGTRAVPVFNIVEWKSRPAEIEAHKAVSKPRAAMPQQAVQQPTQQAATPPSTGSTQMVPPTASTPSQPQSYDFG